MGKVNFSDDRGVGSFINMQFGEGDFRLTGGGGSFLYCRFSE